MSRIFNSELDSILEGTSRSFYLSLKELPNSIRPQVSLLYMLARTSDTIADSEQGDSGELMLALESYNDFSQGKTTNLIDLSALADLQRNKSEASLLRNVEKIVSKIGEFSDSDQKAIRRCLGIIIGGQILDLQRFSSNDGPIIPLESDQELDDYAYRVAGSVGEFWTRMSLDHIFQLKGEGQEEALFEKGIRFGKALQMINILRDIPADLSLGRCYIPRSSLDEYGMTPSDLIEPTKMDSFRPLYDRYLDLTDEYLASAIQYIEMLPHWKLRLRAACMFPVIIGKRTVSKLREGNALDPSNRLKIDRSEIKEVIKKVVFSVPSRQASMRILRD
ncbi:MAG: phytoene/squalene synthase family protein [Candidatus Thalassarchaeaceae archaeon]|nr:phytoene/squalene synthase family protein [Candidatus Thalassarchaeaceae archaeon]